MGQPSGHCQDPVRPRGLAQYPCLVTVVVPHYNRHDLLVRLLHALNRQTASHRTLIVDNGSTDGSREAATRLGATVLPLDRNYGFAYAVNRGIEQARTEHIAILNNDVVPQPDWLAQLLSVDAPFTCGKLLDEADPSRLDGTFDLLTRAGLAWRAGHGHPAAHPDWTTPRTIQFAPMTAALFRREVFDRVGLLDESFRSYLEDVDFGLRCAYVGIQGRYVPTAVATHRGSATLGTWRPETVRLMARNQMLLIAKHYPEDWLWQYGCYVAWGQALWGFAAFGRGRGWSWLSGKWQGIRALKGRVAPRHPELDAILRASETELLELQRRHGYDRLWKVYAWLI